MSDAVIKLRDQLLAGRAAIEEEQFSAIAEQFENLLSELINKNLLTFPICILLTLPRFKISHYILCPVPLYVLKSPKAFEHQMIDS